MTVHNDPWLLWGSEAVITLSRPTTAPIGFTQTQQLAKVRYKRPETWEFMLWCNLVPPTAITGGSPHLWDVSVFFNITVGVGRSSTTVQVPPFIFDPDITPFNTSGVSPQCQRFITQFAVYPMRDKPANPVLPDPALICDHLVASDIQCNVTVNLNGQPSGGDVIVFQVGSMFAPRTHLRPDWFGRPHASQFAGELNGR